MKKLSYTVCVGVIMFFSSCKGDIIELPNYVDEVKGMYDCSITLNELTYKESAEIQILPSSKGGLGKVDINIIFIATNNKIDFTEVVLKKNNSNSTYSLSLNDPNGSLDGKIVEQTLNLKVSSKNTSLIFIGRKR